MTALRIAAWLLMALACTPHVVLIKTVKVQK